MLCKNILPVIILSWITLSGYAQTITGIVVDSVYNSPIDGVKVELLKLPDSTRIGSAQTRHNGSFSVQLPDSSAKYVLAIKHMSYKPFIVQVNKALSLGKIAIAPNVMTIKEVSVNGASIKVTELVDRTVYGIPSEVKKSSTNGLDVLRKTPGVYVDYVNEDVTVEGYTNIQLEVDGIERKKSYLRKLHPSQVDKIEVITAPSGKYDASVEAVVNIITLKEMRYGLKGNVGAELPNPNYKLAHYAAGLDYGLENVSVYASGDLMYHDLNYLYNINRISGNNVLNRYKTSEQERKVWGMVAGVEYTPTDRDLIDFNITANPESNQSTGQELNSSITSGTSKYYKTLFNNDKSISEINNSLYYKHKFDKETEHSFTAEASVFSSKTNKTIEQEKDIYSSNTFNTLLSTGTLKSETFDNSRNSATSRFSYQRPLGGSYLLETGLSSYYQQMDLHSSFSYKTGDNSSKYIEWRNAAFLELSSQSKKFGWKTGARLEKSDITINSNNKKNYFNSLPYANIHYKISKGQSIKLAYARKITRPVSDDLNPDVSGIDTLSAEYGNLNLKPSYRDKLTLTHTLKLKWATLSPYIYYEHRSSPIEDVITVDTSKNTTETFPQNISSGFESGVGLKATAQLSIFRINNNLTLYQTHVKPYLNLVKKQTENTFEFKTNITAQLPREYFVNLEVDYTSPYLKGQQHKSQSMEYYIIPGKRFSNNSSLMLLIANPFSPWMTSKKTTIETETLYQTSRKYFKNEPVWYLRYTWNFVLGKSTDKTHREVQTDKEEKRKDD